MKLKSSLIRVVSQVFLLSVWKSCITSNCVLHEITRMISTLFAFLYKGCTHSNFIFYTLVYLSITYLAGSVNKALIAYLEDTDLAFFTQLRFK